MVILFVVEILEKYRTEVKNHINLLDSMDEGVLIIDESQMKKNGSQKIIFENRVSQKLIRSYLGDKVDDDGYLFDAFNRLAF